MNGDNQRGTGPGEQAALAELERLQRAIEESRKRRVAANDAYDSFMRSFDAAPEARADASTGTQPAAADRTPWPDEAEPAAPPKASTPPELPRRDGSAGLDEFPEEEAARVEEPAAPAVPAALTPPVVLHDRRSRGGVIAIGALAVVAAAVVVWRALPSGTSESPQTPATSAADGSQPQQAPVISPPQPAAAPAPAAQPRPPKAELTTVRRVWVRVLVDGERALERELDANARVPLNPTQRIVVRTGDAGALRVSIDGKDQGPLGRDGEVVTRMFPLSPPPR
jgi:hypothetical protein